MFRKTRRSRQHSTHNRLAKDRRPRFERLEDRTLLTIASVSDPSSLMLPVASLHSETATSELAADSDSAAIHGIVWNDLDNNGLRNDGEPGLANWQVYIDRNLNSGCDSEDWSTTSDSSGNYSFTGLPAGTYRVVEVGQPGWTQTSPIGPASAPAASKLSTVATATDLTSGRIAVEVANSGSQAPADTSTSIVSALPASAVMLDEVPTSTWTYGCSATSAGMLFGYYDRHGYPNMYTGTTNHGVAPLTDLGQGDNPSQPIAGACSIIATQQGFDGLATPGHVNDYWKDYDSDGPDPWETSGTEHTWSSCTADFMGTNQWKWDFNQDSAIDGNSDGGTRFFFYTNGSRTYDFIPPASYGTPQTEGCHGLRLFAESRGYTVLENYTQRVDSKVAGGFSFADYQTEIDNGHPMLTSVVGHTMVGVGYDAATNTVYLHNTWDNSVHSMTWGGSYANMELSSITVIHLAPPPPLGYYSIDLSDGQVVTDKNFGNYNASPLASVQSVSRKEGNSTTRFTFTVTLPARSATPVTIDYATRAGTATSLLDYTDAAGTLTFKPGKTKQTFTVLVRGDKTLENNEAFLVTLSNPTTHEVFAQATGTIVNDDKPPAVSISSNAPVPEEGDSQATAFTFNVKLSSASALPVTVHFATADGTAKADSDYTAASGDLTIAAGDTSGTVTVQVQGDTMYEAHEAFSVILSSPQGAALAKGKSKATATIVNDDQPPSVSIGDATLVQSETGVTAQFVVTLSATSGVEAKVNYSTAAGTAKADKDFKTRSGTLTIPIGQTVGIISIPILGNPASNAGETFYVKLSRPKQATLGDPNQGTCTIEPLQLASLLDALAAGRKPASDSDAQGGLAVDEAIRLLMLADGV